MERRKESFNAVNLLRTFALIVLVACPYFFISSVGLNRINKYLNAYSIQGEAVEGIELKTSWNLKNETRTVISKCASECSTHGTCNEEIGRCDCPPGYSGPNCTVRTMPSCHLNENYVLPCFMPSPCSCGLECAANLFPHSPICFDDSFKTKNPLNIFQCRQESVRTNFEGKKVEPVRVLSKEQGYTDIVKSDECKHSCSGRGICKKRVSKTFCECPSIYGGRWCESTAGSAPFMCFNDCSGNGVCINGFCKCFSGYFGMDCMLFQGMEGSIQLSDRIEYIWRKLKYRPLDNKSTLSRPQIYVYDLPGYFNTWQFMLSNPLDLKEGLFFIERLLSSPYRTTIPENADYFFIPLILRNRDEFKHILIKRVMEYLNEKWPYLKNNDGKNHILLVNDAFGVCELNVDIIGQEYINNLIFLTPYGLKKNLMLEDQNPCFRLGKDISIPPILDSSLFPHTPYLNSPEKRPKRTTFLYFFNPSGLDLVGSGPKSWTFGVVQEMVRLFNGTETETGIHLLDLNNPPVDLYEDLAKSIFCLAPTGFGWSVFATQAVLMGCIPVIIQPFIELPFDSDLINWDEFSVRLNIEDIPKISQTLHSISESEIQMKQSRMEDVWSSFVWISPSLNPFHFLPEEQKSSLLPVLGRKDAFSSIMKMLKLQLIESKRLKMSDSTMGDDDIYSAEYIKAENKTVNEENVPNMVSDFVKNKNLTKELITETDDPAATETKTETAASTEIATETKPEAKTENEAGSGHVPHTDLFLDILFTEINATVDFDDSPLIQSAISSPQKAVKSFSNTRKNATASMKVIRKKCGKSCYEHGTCNEELGYCDCLAGFKGNECSELAFPSCHFENKHSTVCSLPSSCNCALECESYNFVNFEYCYNNVINESTLEKDFDKVVTFPQARLQTNRHGQEISRRVNIDFKFHANVVPSHLCHLNCSRRGVCRQGANNHHFCQCSNVYGGLGCEFEIKDAPFLCYNDCNKRGVCVEGVCKCETGYFGMDCSVFIDSNNNMKKLQPKFPDFLTPKGKSSKKLNEGDVHPLVYVYELPSSFHTWQMLFSHNSPRFEPMIFIERLLASAHRTVNPEIADYFFLPLVLGPRNYKHKTLNSAIKFISQNYPYWNKTSGKNHILLLNEEWGTCSILHRNGFAFPLIQNMILLSIWGITTNMEMGKSQPCFVPEKDIAIPAVIFPWLLSHSPYLNSPFYDYDHNKTTLLYCHEYSGLNLQSSDGFEFSAGVRQKMFKLYGNSDLNATFRFVDTLKSREDRIHWAKKSVFCVSTYGWRWDMTMIESIILGCIPVIVQPNVVLPFENDLLDWSKFSIQLSFEDIPNLPSILLSLSPKKIIQLRKSMANVWIRFLHTSPQFNPLHSFVSAEKKQHYAKMLLKKDVFASVMTILSNRIKRDVHSPSLSDKTSKSKCTEACFDHGSCDEELGVCDCLVGYGGKDCTDLSFPACHLEKDYSPPCFLPSSCACALECANLMFQVSRFCFDERRVTNSSEEKDIFQSFLNNTASFLDIDGDGKEVFRNLLPVQNELMNVVSPQHCLDGCSGRGVCRLNGDVYSCNCPASYHGMGCENKVQFPFPFCLGDCSGHGDCVEGVCKCHRGYFGMDCALFIDSERKAKLVPRLPFQWRGVSVKEKETSVKIYVYNLPGYLNTWQTFHSEHTSRNEPILFLNRLLSSGVRTCDPENADYFFIPLFLGKRDKSKLVIKTIEYISQTWPFFNKTQGKDHILLENDDWGICEVERSGYGSPLFDNFIVLSLWGMSTNMEMEPESPCFRPNQDILLPPSLPINAFKNIPYIRPPSYTHPTRTVLLYSNGHDDAAGHPRLAKYQSSFGVLSAMEQLYTGISTELGIKFVSDLHESSDPDEDMPYSVFCLAPSAWGWDTKTAQAILLGCIPVVIQPGVVQPFEDLLDWKTFSVFLGVKDVANISSILKSIPPEKVRDLQAGLAQVWPRFVWTIPSVNPFSSLLDCDQASAASELAQKDVFASVIQILTNRKQFWQKGGV